MKKTILTLTAAAAALTAGTAIAQQSGQRHSPDADGDRIVTLEETQAQSAARFARMDANGDGVLDAADREARGREMFAEADTDGNGELSQAEMQARRDARMSRFQERREARAERRADRMGEYFARLDTDGSGGLSQEELAAMKTARSENRTDGKRAGRRGMRAGHVMRGMADADGDQAISRAEFDAAVAERFARVDTDGDGSITQAERTAAREAMRAKWQAARQAETTNP